VDDDGLEFMGMDHREGRRRRVYDSRRDLQVMQHTARNAEEAHVRTEKQRMHFQPAFRLVFEGVFHGDLQCRKRWILRPHLACYWINRPGIPLVQWRDGTTGTRGLLPCGIKVK